MTDEPDGRTITCEVLAVVMGLCRAETLKYYRSDSCIASVRILTETLSYFGHAAEPLPVAAGVFNAAGWDAQERGADITAAEGAWSVGISGTGQLRPNGGWDGHLVALVDGRWLGDPSLDQFARPDRGINVAPVVLDLSEWTDRTRFHAWRKPDGVVVSYGPMQDEGAWRQAPDWRANRRYQRQAIGTVIRAVRAAGGEPTRRLSGP